MSTGGSHDSVTVVGVAASTVSACTGPGAVAGGVATSADGGECADGCGGARLPLAGATTAAGSHAAATSAANAPVPSTNAAPSGSPHGTAARADVAPAGMPSPGAPASAATVVSARKVMVAPAARAAAATGKRRRVVSGAAGGRAPSSVAPLEAPVPPAPTAATANAYVLSPCSAVTRRRAWMQVESAADSRSRAVPMGNSAGRQAAAAYAAVSARCGSKERAAADAHMSPSPLMPSTMPLDAPTATAAAAATASADGVPAANRRQGDAVCGRPGASATSAVAAATLANQLPTAL